jgi:hypothetical protein
LQIAKFEVARSNLLALLCRQYLGPGGGSCPLYRAAHDHPACHADSSHPAP